MFKSVRWRNERTNTFKAVFKLQFRATQVLELNVDGLLISVLHDEVEKPTARSEKGTFKDGSFIWEYPIYETLKFTRDAKTWKINDKPCSFLVSTGMSKHGLVGEVSVNFAIYAETTKRSIVSLPLQNSKSNMVLHVSIQRLQGDVNQREVMETEDMFVHSRNKIHNTPSSNGVLDEVIHNVSNRGARLTNDAANTEVNDWGIVSSGSDMTTLSSESSSNPNTSPDAGLRDNSNILHDSTISSRIHESVLHKVKLIAPAKETTNEEHQQSQWDLSADSSSGNNTDDSNISRSTMTTEIFQWVSELSIDELKKEIGALARQVDVSELELQTLRKQILKETKRGQDLSREVIGLKEERDAFKAECEKLKAFQKHIEETKSKNILQYEGGNQSAFLEEIKQELAYEKDMNANLRLQLQKIQESNVELMLAVKDMDEILEQKDKEISNLSNKSRFPGKNISSDDEEQKALEAVVKEHTDAKEMHLSKQKIKDLYSEIEIYKRDKDDLEMQIDQLALDYELLKQKNHEISYQLKQSQLQERLQEQYEYSPSIADISELKAQIERLEDEMKIQLKEYSESAQTIDELKSQIRYLEEELEKQAQGFEADLEAVTLAKIEQEQRAIQAEESLRKTRLKNASIAETLQEEFRKLSMQMASTFEANEKVAVKALAETNELHTQKCHLEDMVQKANNEIQSVRDGHEIKLCELYNQLNSKENQIEQLLADIDDRSKQLEVKKKHEEELAESLSQEIQRLKLELEKVLMDKSGLTEQAGQYKNMEVEMEQLKASIKHAEALIESGNIEKTELLNKIAMMEEHTEKSLEELNKLRSLMDEKELDMQLLRSERETLKAQRDNMKNSLVENEKEKEKLRRQVFQIKSELKKKEDSLANVEKKLKETNKRAAAEGTKSTAKVKKSTPVLHSTNAKEVASLREKIKLLEGHIKLKETALETSTNSFLEKERDLKSKIEELHSRVEELNQNSSFTGGNINEKIIIDTNCTPSIVDTHDNSTTDGNLGNDASFAERNNAIITEDQQKLCVNGNTVDNSEELLSELESLRERNKSMESELKELQVRYSEISLKFAEVEGERQQLVMTVRNLKSSKRS